MQLSLFSKTVLSYGCSGTAAAREALGVCGAKLQNVTTLKTARTARCDAILLLGGEDINPFWYGQEALYNFPPNKDRDTVEWTLARRALAEGIPIMGICRGCQMLAAAAGGGLWQDIHRQKIVKGRHPGRHRVMVKDPLSKYVPEPVVNSRHHQAIRVVPYGWKVVATSTDNIIEAIWRPGALGVQWHPEDLFFENHRWHGLFDWLVNGLKDTSRRG